MGCTREELRGLCEKAIVENPETFYNQPFVNWTGKISDKKTENDYYTEIIAEYLIEENNLKPLFDITEKSRKEIGKKYDMEHTGKLPLHADHSNEKIIAIDIFNQCKEKGSLDYIGDVIDYQTPLKQKKTDEYGEIDLLSAYNDKNGNKTVYMLELKRKETDETMLKCILEVYTYYKLVGKEDLLKEFGKADYKIKISPFVFKSENSQPYMDWIEMKEGKRKNLSALMDKLDVEVVPFFITKMDGKFVVSDK